MSSAALTVAGIALALSIYSTVRPSSQSKAAGPAVCIDQEARGQLDQLRRAVAQRDAVIARLTATATMPSLDPTRGEPLPTPPPSPAADPGPRRYARFEIPNPAVSVTQKADGLLDIHTTDPALSGSILTIVAVTESGDEDKFLIRIP